MLIYDAARKYGAMTTARLNALMEDNKLLRENNVRVSCWNLYAGTSYVTAHCNVSARGAFTSARPKNSTSFGLDLTVNPMEYIPPSVVGIGMADYVARRLNEKLTTIASELGESLRIADAELARQAQERLRQVKRAQPETPVALARVAVVAFAKPAEETEWKSTEHQQNSYDDLSTLASASPRMMLVKKLLAEKPQG